MKIVFIDTSIVGHHMPYISALAGMELDAVAILPTIVPELPITQHELKFPDGPKRKLLDFLKWEQSAKKIIDKEKPDIVHFLMGDDFYRFFGTGLRQFSKYKTVITLHWMRSGIAGKTSTKCIARATDMVVVHSEYIKEKISSYSIRNVEHIEYPQFGTTFYSSDYAKKYWKLKQGMPVIVCIGNTRQDKGLDILLEALNDVKKPFQLFVAGKEAHFTESFIKEKTSRYKKEVMLYLNYLTDDEVALAVSAADIVALPYRKKFDGASGPLGDGVVHGKMIVGSNHGNLGDTIEKNHLGYTFETENTNSLSKVLDRALGEVMVGWNPDQVYLNYQKGLSLEKFKMHYRCLYDKIMQK